MAKAIEIQDEGYLIGSPSLSDLADEVGRTPPPIRETYKKYMNKLPKTEKICTENSDREDSCMTMERAPPTKGTDLDDE